MKQENIAAMTEQDISREVLLEKYAKNGEQSVGEVRLRVAKALAALESDPARFEPLFYQALENGFIPGGRINSAAGTELRATLINCFVQPVGDSVSETKTARWAFTRLCCRRRKPCAAVAASVTTSRASVPRARGSRHQ